jgi:hemoglobin
MTDISSREDIFMVVSTFYSKVRKDELLGPIFNKMIEDWELHFERLTDFWESNLFFKKTYQGDPLKKHIEVDEAVDGHISELHFGTWMNLWYETLDQLFEGEVTQIAKNRARNMGTYFHLKIFEARKNKN